MKIEELKQDFFDTFTDDMDEENGYYDSEFAGQKPYEVWNWVANKVGRLEPMVIKGASQPVKNAEVNLKEIIIKDVKIFTDPDTRKFEPIKEFIEDLEEDITRYIVRTINNEGEKFKNAPKEDPTIRAIFMYMADLFKQ